jgi:hypothetical protein
MDEGPVSLWRTMFSPLFRHRSMGRVNARRAPGPAACVTLRLATDEDDDDLVRLAALYDRPLPSGPLLLAEVDGELQAALTLTGAQELMEPYLPTAALVELLALRAKHLRDQMTPAEPTEAARLDHTPARSRQVGRVGTWTCTEPSGRNQHAGRATQGHAGLDGLTEQCAVRQTC